MGGRACASGIQKTKSSQRAGAANARQVGDAETAVAFLCWLLGYIGISTGVKGSVKPICMKYVLRILKYTEYLMYYDVSTGTSSFLYMPAHPTTIVNTSLHTLFDFRQTRFPVKQNG